MESSIENISIFSARGELKERVFQKEWIFQVFNFISAGNKSLLSMSKKATRRYFTVFAL